MSVVQVHLVLASKKSNASLPSSDTRKLKFARSMAEEDSNSRRATCSSSSVRMCGVVMSKSSNATEVSSPTLAVSTATPPRTSTATNDFAATSRSPASTSTASSRSSAQLGVALPRVTHVSPINLCKLSYLLSRRSRSCSLASYKLRSRQ